MIVFTVRNTITGQVYVGTTSLTLEERWSQLVSSIHTSLDYPLYNDIRRHGEAAFELREWAVAESRSEARDLETEAIEAENALSLRGYKTAATLRNELKAADIDQAVERMLDELRTPSVLEPEQRTKTARPAAQTRSSGTPTRSSTSSARSPESPAPITRKEPLQKRLSSSKEKRIREAIKAEKARREAEKQARIAAEQDEMAAILARLDARSKEKSRLHRKL